jgi:hypothetical protein
MWHCPHCGAPQAESARCWVCRRSSTTCSTCSRFRTSLAADIGFCALDRRRRPLTGLELRGCWTQASATAEGQTAAGAAANRLAPDRRKAAPVRGFVPLDTLERPLPMDPLAAAEPEAAAPIVLLGDPIDAWEARTSLFGEPER